ncbi:Gar1-domain-containing protein [Aspergillus sclerotiicarbonarius CBS 121057]|uniref:H/ACA ribonucleoprotein complex subunit n=1 Tax=Aspergillus sclerotiicarbonarius (strain CBS 121057 / IBT 28362) TaxID=1448318 RepID=A0A319DSQ9_ASPSB|nr:Gar1-domain-containing protein [Aspergillus sclerotiicarbonarius CBS 121057]
MSFRGGRGFASGANRGGFGGRGGRGGFQAPVGPPAQVLEMGTVMHSCEGEMVCESVNPKIPYFNAPIYLENKTPIGKVDEVLGPINQVYFTIKPQEGIVATSFKPGDKVYIGGDKLLPLEKYVLLILVYLGNTTDFATLGSFPSLSPPSVPRSPRELVVVPEAVPCAVVGVDVVVPCAVAVAAHRGDVVDPVEVASAVEAVVSEVVVSRGVAAEEDLVEVVVSDARQSLSCLVVLCYYGVLGKGSYCRNLFVSIFLCILGKICWFSVRRGCRESQPSNSCIATINYAEYYCSSTIHELTKPYLPSEA